MDEAEGSARPGAKAAAQPAAAKAVSAGKRSRASEVDDEPGLEENEPLQRLAAAPAAKGGKAKAPPATKSAAPAKAAAKAAPKAEVRESMALQRGEKGQLKLGGRRSVAA